jgi:outer membrane immunogenic protein
MTNPKLGFIPSTISKLALPVLAVAVLAALFVAPVAKAQVSDELESLSSNKQVNDRAAHLESRTRMGIVQGRAVDRHWRVEVGASYGPVAYGDSYVNTQNGGANLDLHISPRASLGVHYAHAFNQLTSEGQQVFDQARSARKATGDFSNLPQVSYPEESVMGVVNWYMMYGKINLFDWRTVQFDIYSLAGYGQIKVSSTYDSQITSVWTNTWTAGGGVGFWLSQHVTSRFELRYQSYADKVYSGSRDLNLIVANLGIGFLI